MDTNAYANLVAPSVYDGGSQVAYPLARKAEETMRGIPHPERDYRNVGICPMSRKATSREEVPVQLVEATPSELEAHT